MKKKMIAQKPNKSRLDAYIAKLYPEYSKQQIQSFIIQGLVYVDNKIITKPGTLVRTDKDLDVKLIKKNIDYVSRAGYKIAHALDSFKIDVTGLTALDAGISTGGFSDCLLQRNINKIYGIDVGYGLVHEKIRNNPKLVLLERTNLRFLTRETIGESVDLVTLDLSFISVLKVMDAVCSVLKPNGILIVLIKPQFEAERTDIGRGGIIKDPLVHKRITDSVTQEIVKRDFVFKDLTESPITGTSGNKEFLAYFIYTPKA